MIGFNIANNSNQLLSKAVSRTKRMGNVDEKVAEELGNRGENFAKRKVRVKTGKTKSSIQQRKVSDGVREIFTPVKWGPALEGGRGEVLPVNKMALFWPGLPHPVKRAGPSKAYPFMKPTAEYLKKIAPLVVISEVKKAMK